MGLPQGGIPTYSSHMNANERAITFGLTPVRLWVILAASGLAGTNPTSPRRCKLTGMPKAPIDAYTGAGLIEFLDAAIEKGWVNPSTAKAMKTASQKILEVESGWQSMDLRSLDVDSLVARFRNLRRNDYSDDSMRLYHQRFNRALKMHLARQEDDKNWMSYGPKATPRLASGNGSRNGGRKGATAAVPGPREAMAAEADKPAEGAAPSGSTTTSGSIPLMRFPFPLRDTVDVYLTLPRDLSSDEADRLSVFIRSLAHTAPTGSVIEAS